MTPEEILKKTGLIFVIHHEEQILNAMQEYGRQEFNRALELAAEKVKISSPDCECHLGAYCDHPYSIDKDSILKLKY